VLGRASGSPSFDGKHVSTPTVAQPGPLLDLRDVHRHFPGSGGTVRALDGVSLTIAPGDALGLVGESGCGKSTLGRVSLGLERVDKGAVLIDGTDLTAISKRDLRLLRKRMQMVFQDPISSLNPRMTVGRIIAEPLHELQVGDRPVRPARVRELLDLVGLSASFVSRYPGQLSGGQAQRVAIARALAVRPSLLVADEAVSALDVSVGAQILNLFSDLRQEFGLSYLFISHDLGVVEHVSDRVAVMYLGKVMEHGTSQDIFRRPQHPYTVALLSATPTPDPAQAQRRERIILPGDPPSPANPPSGCRFRTRCPIGPLANPDRTVCAEQEPPLSEMSAGHWAACHFAGELETPGDQRKQLNRR
jgi:peptide/nickel transport system ATP-binding protein